MGKEADKKIKTENKTKAPRPEPVAPKVGEHAGNLRKREQWFRKQADQ
jgi:hypothetical protein